MANSHKRDLMTGRSRTIALAAPLAFVATVATISVGVAASGASSTDKVAVDTSYLASSITAASERGETVSRDNADRTLVREGVTVAPVPTAADRAMRPKRVKAAIAGADDKKWTTTALNLWTRPDERAEKAGVVDSGREVRVTGRELDGRVEIVLKGESRWVSEGYLADQKPVAATPAAASTGGGTTTGSSGAGGGTGGTCANGTSVPGGVSSHIRNIHAAVCSRWPQIRNYGTLRGGGGDHARGRAIDIMTSGQTGWDIANYLRANAGAFGITYVIYAQKIWSIDRAGEGWRHMSDRGSATANHYDHVHVSVR